MPRSATTAYRKTGRPSPKKAKPTAPEKGKRTAAKRTTQRSPKWVTPTSQKKPNQTSVAAMQARIKALEADLPRVQVCEAAGAAFDLLPIGIGIFNQDLCLVYCN